MSGLQWKLSRAAALFRRLPFGLACRLTIVNGFRSFLDGNQRSSYSQIGDDLLIDALLGSRPAGWYVDIGCHDPVYLSNTFQLYTRGWRGLVVDANPALIARFKRSRPHDIAVCAAVSDIVETRSFVCSRQPEVSSLIPELISEADRVSETVVVTTTLTSLLETHKVPHDFDLLSIDIEGFDVPALAGLDWMTYRPRIIVVEMHGFDIANPSSSSAYTLLTNQGYRLVGLNILNGFFCEIANAANARPVERCVDRA